MVSIDIPQLEAFFWLVFKMSVASIFILMFVDMYLSQSSDWRKKPSHRIKEKLPVPSPDAIKIAPETITFQAGLTKSPLKQYKKKIGDILLEQKLITKDVLDKALEHQKQYGGNITQYLLHHQHINQQQLAQCLCAQFGVPYLPLESYSITKDIIDLIPTDIAQKYWVLPVDRNGDVLTVVMIDPLDSKAIKELEDFTGLRVVPFVGIISEILFALQSHYKLFIKDKQVKPPQFFVTAKTYVGAERRASIRYQTKIAIQFSFNNRNIKSQTFDVCRDGFGLRLRKSIPIGTILTMEIKLPKDVSPLPIAAVTQVVRCVQRTNSSFEIGVKILKIAKSDINMIINYAIENLI